MKPPAAVSYRQAVRHGLVIAGLITAAWMYVVVGHPRFPPFDVDGLVYWSVNLDDPYHGSTVGGVNAYLYSPAFAQTFSPLSRLPREAFMIAWSALLAGVAWWLARPWPAALLVLALPVSAEVLTGNIHLLLAAAIVLGFRRPGTWAFVLLTKVTPGVGLVWFAARREWRALVVAGVTAAVVAAASFALSPSAWWDWYRLLRDDGGAGAQGLVPRLVVAAVIAVWGARTDRRWTVPLAAMLALPVIWTDSFSMLLGCVALGARPARDLVAVAAQPALAPSDATA